MLHYLWKPVSLGRLRVLVKSIVSLMVNQQSIYSKGLQRFADIEVLLIGGDLLREGLKIIGNGYI